MAVVGNITVRIISRLRKVECVRRSSNVLRISERDVPFAGRHRSYFVVESTTPYVPMNMIGDISLKTAIRRRELLRPLFQMPP
jgi:hypothetical protein